MDSSDSLDSVQELSEEQTLVRAAAVGDIALMKQL